MAITKAPVRKAERQYSGWIYLLFLLEYIFVAVPVGELIVVMSAVGILDRANNSSKSSKHRRQSSAQLEVGGESLETAAAKQEKMREKIRERIGQSLEDQKKREKERRRQEQGLFLTTLIVIRKSFVKMLQRIGFTLWIFLRSLLAPVWIAILVIEYLILLNVVFLQLLVQQTFKHKSNQTAAAGSSGGPPQPKPTGPFLQAAQILGLTALFPNYKGSPVKDSHNDQADFEFRAVTRVATKLNFASPRVKSSPSMNSVHTNSSTAKLVKSPTITTNGSIPDPPQIIRTYTDPLGHHAEDILRIRGPGATKASSATVAPRAFGVMKSDKTIPHGAGMMEMKEMTVKETARARLHNEIMEMTEMIDNDRQ